MKKILSIIIVIALLCVTLTLSSCNSFKENTNVDSGKIKIVTSIFPYYEFARNVAGDKADVKLLLSPGNEPHSYEPSPSDIVAIENCDIFIYNGGESDKWVSGMLTSIKNTDMTILKMTDYVDLLLEQSGDHTHHDHDEHEHSEDNHTKGEKYDEHIWTSVRNAKVLSSKISETLSKIDSDNSNYYSDNEKYYSSQLDKLDEEFKNIVKNSKRHTVVFADRFPFLYFSTDYNLEYEAAFPSCSSKSEPSVSAVTHIIDFVRDENIPVVFYLEFSNGRIPQLIAEDTQAKTLLFSSCHNVTKEDFESGVTYISLMEQNASALKEALS